MAQATQRPHPKVMTLTDAAAARVHAIIARSETPVMGLRVGVKNGGCAMEYTMDWAPKPNLSMK
jgi:iron-sulfur cluster assembly protein